MMLGKMIKVACGDRIFPGWFSAGIATIGVGTMIK